MHADLAELGWTEEQWNRICSAVTEEAHKARMAAQLLPVSGPEHPSVVAIPNYRISDEPNRAVRPPPHRRLKVNSDPNLPLTTIAVNVHLNSYELADPNLSAALVMFRRAANYVARIEDALVFGGRRGPKEPPPFGLQGIPRVFTVSGSDSVAGIFMPIPSQPNQRIYQGIAPKPAARGEAVFNAIVKAIDKLEAAGQLGPYACGLSHDLFEDVCTPNNNLVLPRDRILPFLSGPLLRSSAVVRSHGAVIASSGSPIELHVAREIHVRYLQTTLEPRYVFRVSERVALRIEDERAIALLYPTGDE